MDQSVRFPPGASRFDLENFDLDLLGTVERLENTTSKYSFLVNNKYSYLHHLQLVEFVIF